MKSVTLSSFQRNIIVLIAIITIINFIDRSSISFAIEPIQKDFGISNTEFGIIAAAFGIGYIFTTFLGGIVVDKFGTVGTWAISAIVWSIATMLLALGEGFWSFFWLRIFLGVAEGIHFPALLRTVTDWIPLRWRASATAFGLFGIPFATILGAPLTTYLITAYSWKHMFIVLGTLGIIWSFFWLVLFRHHPKALFKSVSSTTLYPTAAPKVKTPWLKILGNRNFQASCAIYFAFGYSVFFALMWLPGYLTQIYNVSIIKTGYLVLPPWICAAAFMLVGGWFSDHIWKRTNSLRKSRSYIMGWSLLISALCFIAIPFSHSLALDLVWMSLGLGFAFILQPPLYALNADLFGPYAGVAQGMTSSFFALSGIISPGLTGWITQLTGNFQAAFFVAAGMSIVTSLIVIVFQKPDKEKRYI